MNGTAARAWTELQDTVAGEIDRETAKVVAFKLKVPQRTVENWQARVNRPSALNLFALSALYPAVRGKMFELLAAQAGDSGEDPSRVLNDIIRLIVGRAGAA